MTSYSPIPKRYSRLKAYLYFKQTISPYLELKGARKTDDTTRVLLLSAIDKNYVEGCAQNLKACGQTVRNHLKQLNPQHLLQINQQTIKEMKRKGALSKPLTLAIDWHDIMYYGNPAAEGIVGAMPKNGSCLAYRFATASVLLNGQRLTLAVVPMLDRSALLHVRHLLTCIAELGLKVKLLLFDRGYYSIDLIRYLDSCGMKYIIHIPWHGKPLGAGVDRLYTTTTCKKRKDEQAVFRLLTIRQKGKLLIFATNTVFKRRWVRKTFRKRWGIETSYRLIGLFLAKTTSRRYRLRLLYFFLAVVLYNLWVLWNFRRRRHVSTHSLVHAVRLCLALSLLPDLEACG
jgi:hypothetical protein